MKLQRYDLISTDCYYGQRCGAYIGEVEDGECVDAEDAYNLEYENKELEKENEELKETIKLLERYALTVNE